MFEIDNKIKKIDGINEVTNEKDYWIRQKEYKKKFRKLSVNIIRLMGDPNGFILDFERLLSEALSYGVFNSEQVEKMRKDMYDEITSNSKIRSKIYSKLEKVKKKFVK